jgi:glutathione S-transferase
MKLYYAPGTGSLASRIMLHEADLVARYESVDLATRATETGADFRTINPQGYVPALVHDSGEILTENGAILYWIDRRAPGAAPAAPLGPVRLLEALAFIATEVHKPLRPFFVPAAGAAERSRAAAAISGSLALVASSRCAPYLFGSRFTAADAYLFVMLRWASRFGVAVPPALATLAERAAKRPHVQTALAEEGLSNSTARQRAG